MIALDCEQGSEEWIEARLGIPTASEFDKILTATGKTSQQAAKYRLTLLAERLMRAPADPFSTRWTERGKEMEPEAREFYEFKTGKEVKTVGFCYRDEEKALGCSPDGLVGRAGGLEIKCLSPPVHTGHLLARARQKARWTIPTEFCCQVQGCLYVTGRRWWDLLLYHPELDPILVREKPVPEYQQALHLALKGFLATLERDWEVLRKTT